MKPITVYTMKYCPYCESAKKLLKQRGYSYEEKMVDENDDAEWDRLEKLTGFKSMPQIFIGEKFVGGFRELSALDKNGELASWVN